MIPLRGRRKRAEASRKAEHEGTADWISTRSCRLFPLPPDANANKPFVGRFPPRAGHLIGRLPSHTLHLPCRSEFVFITQDKFGSREVRVGHTTQLPDLKKFHFHFYDYISFFRKRNKRSIISDRITNESQNFYGKTGQCHETSPLFYWIGQIGYRRTGALSVLDVSAVRSACTHKS